MVVDPQTRVQCVIDLLVTSGAETGVQVAVVHEGDVVVDAVAGLADPHTQEPVTADTLFFAASTGKGVATPIAHIMVERGDLRYDQPVAEVWPEFATHGKDRVTLRHVLLHTAGVPGLWPQISAAGLCDWDRMCAFIADQEPWWTPGSQTGYHALTFGFVLGELVRRATKRTLAAVLREDIAGPLAVRDELHFGVPDAQLTKVARQGPEGAAPPPPEPGSPLDRALPAGVQPTAAFANRRDILHADIPSQGAMSARAVARMYAALLGDIDGVELVSPRRLTTMAAPAFSDDDQVMGIPTTWALGYSTARLGVDSRPGSTFGMIGSNGTAAYADIDSGVAVALMRNRITTDMTAIAEVDRIIADTFRPTKQ
jgi:CubicO group peptidase (beta-lactamase class C family)